MATIILKATSILLSVVIAAGAMQFHVKPAGISSGSGSDANPWDLATAFSQPSPVKAGDTVWLHGGTYQVTSGLTSNLTGTSTNPILIRQYPGERATLNVGASNANRLFINGSYAWYWGFEVMSSASERWTDSTGSGALVKRGLGIDIGNSASQKGIKCINIVLHDCAGGFGFWSGATESEIHGCLIYYNGWDAPDRGHTHAIYAQNQTGRKYLTDNIMFGQYSYGIHCYTEGGFIDSLTIEGNISFNSGAISTISGLSTDILVGGAKVAQNPIVQNNFTYFTLSRNGGTGINLGYGANVANPVVKNNYCASGGTALKLTSTTPNPIVTGNTFYGPVSGVSAATCPDNEYFTSANKPAGVKVFVRPNKYEAGRANICIFNWDNADSARADISSIQSIGDRYEVRDAQNFYGEPAVSGTYAGGSITIPLNLTAVAPVIGAPATPYVHTPREFNAFVLLKTGSINAVHYDKNGASHLVTPRIALAGNRLKIAGENDGIWRVDILDASGRMTASQFVKSSQAIDWRWPAGTYFVKVVGNKGEWITKVVVGK